MTDYSKVMFFTQTLFYAFLFNTVCVCVVIDFVIKWYIGGLHDGGKRWAASKVGDVL
jgi:hypothetical protein